MFSRAALPPWVRFGTAALPGLGLDQGAEGGVDLALESRLGRWGWGGRANARSEDPPWARGT